MQRGMAVLVVFNAVAVIAALIYTIIRCCKRKKKTVSAAEGSRDGSKYDHKPPFDRRRKPTGSILKPYDFVVKPSGKIIRVDTDDNEIQETISPKSIKKAHFNDPNFEDSLLL